MCHTTEITPLIQFIRLPNHFCTSIIWDEGFFRFREEQGPILLRNTHMHHRCMDRLTTCNQHRRICNEWAEQCMDNWTCFVFDEEEVSVSKTPRQAQGTGYTAAEALFFHRKFLSSRAAEEVRQLLLCTFNLL